MMEAAVPLLVMPESAMRDAKHRMGWTGWDQHHWRGKHTSANVKTIY